MNCKLRYSNKINNYRINWKVIRVSEIIDMKFMYSRNKEILVNKLPSVIRYLLNYFSWISIHKCYPIHPSNKSM